MDTFKKYLITMISIGLLGEIYFYPFHGEFRFSAGVVAFSLVLLLVDELNEIVLSIFIGFFIGILRTFIGSVFQTEGISFIYLFYTNLPGAIYYIIYGVLAYFLCLRKNQDNLYITIISLFSIDVIGNVVELILRGNLSYRLFILSLFIGLIRSILSYIIFNIIKRKERQAKKNEYRKRYIQLNTLVSNIQAEMFYLKKSMKDIEDVMSKSYSLYEDNKHHKEISTKALDIAREVHEIKKDYYRVLDGFESFLEDFETNEAMSFHDIASIIEGNTNRYMKERKKEIQLHITIKEDLYIHQYYSIFTILNNLITNAIDSIQEKGEINITQWIQEDYVYFLVSDNGEGIDEDLIPYIFIPGFTTKFDEKSGNSSTGIGLSHVKNIIDELRGSIEVESNTRGTEFRIHIPINSLKG